MIVSTTFLAVAQSAEIYCTVLIFQTIPSYHMVHLSLCRSLVEDCRKRRFQRWQQESVNSLKEEARMLFNRQGNIRKSHYCINQERVTIEMTSLHSIISLPNMYGTYFSYFKVNFASGYHDLRSPSRTALRIVPWSNCPRRSSAQRCKCRRHSMPQPVTDAKNSTWVQSMETKRARRESF